MTLRTATRRAFLYPAAAAATDWWLSGGISAANAIAVYQPKGAASLAASYVNLANPGTYDAAPGVAPTFNTVTGWTFDGSTYLIGATIDPGTSAIIVRFANTASGGTVVGGQTATANRYNIWPDDGAGGEHRYTVANYDQLNIPGIITNGVMAISGFSFYLNGTSEADGSGTPGTAGGPLYIGARNLSGTADSFYTGDVLTVAFYDTVLTAAQVAAVSTAAAAL